MTTAVVLDVDEPLNVVQRRENQEGALQIAGAMQLEELVGVQLRQFFAADGVQAGEVVLLF